jgi:uncharacterized protein
MSIATIDVSDLVGQPGASRQATLTGTIDGLATEVARVPDDAPIEVQLLLESVIEGILVSGSLRGTFSLVCSRCLTTFESTFDVDVHELFVPEPEEDTDDYRLDPERGVVTEQMARDAIGVSMPFSPLCRPDCQGLCEVCGGNRNLGECPGHEDVDPRFAVLSGLFPDDTEPTDD